MPNEETVISGKAATPQEPGVWRRFMALRGIWKLTILELVFWAVLIAFAAFNTWSRA